MLVVLGLALDTVDLQIYVDCHSYSPRLMLGCLFAGVGRPRCVVLGRFGLVSTRSAKAAPEANAGQK
jgi:hypothetical protein